MYRVPAISKKASVWLLLIFPIYFYFSGVHRLQFLGEDGSQYISSIKKLLFSALSILMLVFLFTRDRLKWESLFVLPLLLIFFEFISSVFNLNIEGGFSLMVRISFFLLGIFWIAERISLRAAFKWCASWYSHKLISLICVVLVLGYFWGTFRVDVSSGFGNSRGGFGIWLFQLTCISFFTLRAVEKNKFEYVLFLVFLPIFILQCVVASRVGMIASLLMACYFFWVNYDWRKSAYCLLASALASILISKGLHLIDLNDRAIDPLRYSEAILYVDDGLSGVERWIEVFDRYISYRLTIARSAFSNISFNDLLFGVGLGNFKGGIPRYPHLGLYDVHNVYLKMFGEYGVFAFFTLSAIVLNGLRHAYAFGVRRENWDLFVVQLLYVGMSMFHPDLLLTAIGTSLVYMFSYAMASREFGRENT